MSRRHLFSLSTIAVMGFSLLSGNAIAQEAPSARVNYDVVILNVASWTQKRASTQFGMSAFATERSSRLARKACRAARHSMPVDLSYRLDSLTCTSTVKMLRTMRSRSPTALPRRSNLRSVSPMWTRGIRPVRKTH